MRKICPTCGQQVTNQSELELFLEGMKRDADAFILYFRLAVETYREKELRRDPLEELRRRNDGIDPDIRALIRPFRPGEENQRARTFVDNPSVTAYFGMTGIPCDTRRRRRHD